VQQLTDHQPDVERVISESNKLVKISTTSQVSTNAQQLEAKYSTLVDTAKVRF